MSAKQELKQLIAQMNSEQLERFMTQLQIVLFENTGEQNESYGVMPERFYQVVALFHKSAGTAATE